MTTFGEWFEGRDRPKSLPIYQRPPGLMSLFISLPFAVLVIALFTGAQIGHVLANSLLSSLVAIGLTLGVGMQASTRQTSYVSELIDSPAEFDQHPVQVTLWCGALNFGVDAGVVSIVESWLVYEGLLTRFVVQHGIDVRAMRMGHSGLSWVLSSRTNGRLIRLTMSPLDLSAGQTTHFMESAAKFGAAMSRWTLIDYGSGSAVLPVMQAQPGLRKRSRRIRRTCAILLVPTIAMACLAWYVGGLVLCALIAPAIVTVPYLLMSSTLWLEQADEMDAGKTPKRRSVLTACTFRRQRPSTETQ